MDLKDLSAMDASAARRVVAWLKGEAGAVSAKVDLPSGKKAVIFPNGKVEVVEYVCPPGGSLDPFSKFYRGSDFS